MNIQDALNKIFSMHQFDIKLGLDRIKKLLELIGNPHSNLKYIHIAGSNGKGSTASFIASILMEAGYKVGLYTSPHLVRFNERIRINGIEIDDSYIAAFIHSIEHIIEHEKPTFFEITTALAFKYFNENNPDYVVLETGLGGRLDATNVINPLASVITSISLEHTNILGETLEKIAFEKAGIIKPGNPVFTGSLPEEALDVIKNRAENLNSQLFVFNQFTESLEQSVNISLDKKNIHIYKTGLSGSHQFHNSAIAIKVLYELLNISDISIINKGLMNVVTNTGIQGRYEIINDRPRVIFDAAHNPEGIASFISEFSKEYINYPNRVLIFGAMKDKDIISMLNQLKPYFNTFYAVQPEYDRAATIEELVEIGERNGIYMTQLKEYSPLIEDFIKGETWDCLVVLGSIYLLGEIKSKMIKKNLTNR
jgi:dihydrofolate synthase/folylpolyglutamate synthase